jgi:hypothetical protein
MNEIQELLQWVEDKRKPKFRPHLSQTQNQFVRSVGIEHANEIEKILRKRRSARAIQNYKTKGPKTSKDAALSISTESLKWRLLVVFSKAEDGLTAYEASDLIEGENVNEGCWKRVSELATTGLINRTDFVRRNARTGKDNSVYVITEHGRKALQK